MANKVIKGITIEIGGDATKLGKALQGVETQSNALSKELKDINQLLKLDPGNTDLLAQKQQVLANAISTTKEKLDTLRQAEEQVQAQFARGEATEEQVRALQREIVATENKLKSYESAAQDSADAMQKLGKSGDGVKSLTKTVGEQETKLKALKAQYVDVATSQGKNSTAAKALEHEIKNLSGELNQNKSKLSEAESAADKFDKTVKETEKDSAKLGETLKNGLKAGLVAVGAAMAAAGAAAVATGKQVVSSYADYEQLVGGIDTLFKGSSKTVQEYAANAYKTAGISANQYMETVTSFSASLISSLGGDTEKAAKYANMAIVDMSDNANKMGTDMASIENAYQGFAKQNYTMLDNLKLGYGGTKEEMERLLEDATKISGIKYDISSYADVVAAIHTIQQEMGIAGATAAEAETTISGSIGSLKAAFENLVVGFGDANANMTQLTQNVISAFNTVVQNITPVIQNIINALPTVVNALLSAVQNLLPQLLSTATNLLTQVLNAILTLLPSVVTQLVNAFGMLLQSMTAMLPQLLTAGVQIITTILNGLTQAIPQLVQAMVSVIPKLVQALASGIPQLIQGAVKLFLAIVQAIPQIIPPLVAALPKIVTSVINTLIAAIPALLQGAIKFLQAIVQALPTIISQLVAALPKLVSSVVRTLIANIPAILKGAITLFKAIVDAIPKIVVMLVKAVPQIITAVCNGLIHGLGQLGQAAARLGETILGKVREIPSKMSNIGKDLVRGLWNGINNMTSWVIDKIQGFGKNVLDGIKKFFGIKSPSREFAKIGRYLDEGLAEGLTDNMDDPVKAAQKVAASVMDEAQDIDGLSIERDLQNRAKRSAMSVTTTADSSMLSKLDKILTAIEKGQVITLDGKQLVGGTASAYDRALGQRRMLAERGAI